MACKVCGRGACTESFHSIEEQERAESRHLFEDEIAELNARIRELESLVEELRDTVAVQNAALARQAAGLAAVQGLIDETHGVYGMHLPRPGDNARWSELLAGGPFETWLNNFSDAIGDSDLAPWRALVEAVTRQLRAADRHAAADDAMVAMARTQAHCAACAETESAARACGLGTKNEEGA